MNQNVNQACVIKMMNFKIIKSIYNTLSADLGLPWSREPVKYFILDVRAKSRSSVAANEVFKNTWIMLLHKKSQETVS